MGLYEPRTRTLTSDQLAWIREQHPEAAFVKVYFEGGHDSGGVISIELLNADKKQRGTLDASTGYREQTWNPATREWDLEVLTPERERAYSTVSTLTQPVYDEYHSFAGEFSVEGFVMWSVGSGAFLGMRGTQVVEQYDYFGDADLSEFE